MIRESLFNIILLVGFTIFLVVFVLWAYQQYRLQKMVAEEELASLRRTQYAVAQLYKSGALDERRPMMKNNKPVGNSVKASQPLVQQQFTEENFEDAATSLPGADLPSAFVNALDKAKMVDGGKKLAYEFPSADFQMAFGAEGEKPELAVDINAKNLKITPPPRCENVTNQYIYDLNKQILAQNKRAEEINKLSADMNRRSLNDMLPDGQQTPSPAQSVVEEGMMVVSKDPRKNMFM